MNNIDALQDRTLKAVVLMMAGMMILPLGDTFAKLAAEATTYSGATLAWARLALGAALVVPIVAMTGQFKALTLDFWLAQVLRGALLASTIVCIITSVGLVPMADAFGAFFIGPFVATLLARWGLDEPVHQVEWWGIAFGLLGVVLIVKPSTTMATGQLWALGAGCFYGGYLTATRWAKSVGPSLVQLAGQLCIGVVLLTPLALSQLTTADIQAPSLLFGSGVASALANLLAIMALGLARAATLTPLVYCQLISATALGWLVFRDVPDALTATGLIVVFVAGIGPHIFGKERSKGRA